MTVEEEAERDRIAHVLDLLVCIAVVFERTSDEQQRGRAWRASSRNGPAVHPAPAPTADERRKELVQRVRRQLALPRQAA